VCVFSRDARKNAHFKCSSAVDFGDLQGCYDPLQRLLDKLRLRKRAIVETIIDQLKNISQIEHTRHRSPFNFLVNLLCGLIAYCHQPKKPSLHLDALPMLPA